MLQYNKVIKIKTKNMSIDKQPDALKAAPAEGLTQALEAKINAFKYDREAFLKTATDSINHGKYSLTKSEIAGKYDATEDKITEAQVKKYFDGKGGDAFCRDLFEQGKEALLQDYSKNINKYYKEYVDKVMKKDAERAKTKGKMTKEESEEETRNVEALFNYGHINLNQLTLEQAMKENVFPRFTSTTIIAQALSIADNENKGQRQEAIFLKDIASTKTESVKCRRDLAPVMYKEKPKYTHYYEVGEGEMPDKDAKKAPKLSKDFQYKVETGATVQTFDSKIDRSDKYKKNWQFWQKIAKEYWGVRQKGCQITNKFKSYANNENEILRVIDALSRLDTRGISKESRKAYEFNPATFKKDLEAIVGNNTALIYGKEGVFNMLIAFQRAQDLLKKQQAERKEKHEDPIDESKIIYEISLSNTRSKKGRFMKIYEEDRETSQYKTPKEPAKAPIPLQGRMPAETAEVKKDLLEQYGEETAKLLPEVEKATGVKIVSETTKDSFAKHVILHGEYKGEKKQFLNVILAGGKLMLRPNEGKGPDDYTDLKEAVAATKARLLKRAESMKTARDSEVQKGGEAAKEAAKEQWYKDFDAFLEENKDDFMDVPSIKIRKEMGAKNSYPEGKETISITHDYVITVGAPVNIDMLVVPVVEEGKVKLWARVENKEKTGMTMKQLSMKINFKSPKQFAADSRARASEFKAMEGAPKPLPPLPKPAPAAPKPAPAVGLPAQPTPDKAKVQPAPAAAPKVQPAAPAKPVEAQKPLTEGLSAEAPKDMAMANTQLHDVYKKLEARGLKEAHGFVGTMFTVSIDIPNFGPVNYHISTEAGDAHASDELSAKPHFKIKQGPTDTIAANQKELMQRLEKILGKK